jgi:hypothetical protein
LDQAVEHCGHKGVICRVKHACGNKIVCKCALFFSCEEKNATSKKIHKKPATNQANSNSSEVIYTFFTILSTSHHAEGLVNPKSSCKKKRLLILDTPEHVDSEKPNRQIDSATNFFQNVI